MKVLWWKIEIKHAPPTETLSRLSERVTLMAADLDAQRKLIEATRRKVYRELVADSDPEAIELLQQAAKAHSAVVRSFKTGEPAE